MGRVINGMVVLVTGASAGIGLALARELSARGAQLALAARRFQRLERLNGELGGRHLCVQTDVSSPEQCRRLVDETIRRFGRLDTLVCNAGFGLIRPAAELTADDLARLFATNVVGTTECIRHAVPRMATQPLRDGWRGQVVVVSSAAGRRGLPEFGAYTASKAAQLSLAEALRVELVRREIAVTTVHPCGTSTEFFRAAIRQSGRTPPRRNSIEVHQSAEKVAQAIAAAVAKPRAEVWPVRRFRFLMGLATLFPALTDRILMRRLLGTTWQEPEALGCGTPLARDTQ